MWSEDTHARLKLGRLQNPRRPIGPEFASRAPRPLRRTTSTVVTMRSVFSTHNVRDSSRHRLLSPLALGLALLCLLVVTPSALAASQLGKRDFKHLSSDEMAKLIAHPDPIRSVDPKDPNSHLSKILIPRPPDTANNTLVREYLVSTLKKLDWHVEEDSFNDTTPYGVKRFTNVIATKDPSAPRRVIVAAHFDSKFFSQPPQDQVRVTFSCVPASSRLW